MDGISQIIMQHLETVNMQQKVNNSRGGAASSRTPGQKLPVGPPSNHLIIHETINSQKANQSKTKQNNNKIKQFICVRGN